MRWLTLCIACLVGVLGACNKETASPPKAPAADSAIALKYSADEFRAKVEKAAIAGYTKFDTEMLVSLRTTRALEQDFGADLGFAEVVSKNLKSGERFFLGMKAPGTESMTMGSLGRERVFVPIQDLLKEDDVGKNPGPQTAQHGILLMSILAYCSPQETALNDEVVENLLKVKWAPQVRRKLLEFGNELKAKHCLAPETLMRFEPLADEMRNGLAGLKGAEFVSALGSLARFNFANLPVSQIERLAQAQETSGGFLLDGATVTGNGALQGAYVLAAALRAQYHAGAKEALEGGFRTVAAQKTIPQPVTQPTEQSPQPELPR